MNNFELMTNANKDLVSLGIFFNQFAADTGRGRDKMDKKIIDFLIKAKQKTYAGKGAETASSREKSHDLVYCENNFMYYDTYLGGEKFAGEEALWIADKPYWAMNYIGRVTGENFSGDFLREALLNVPFEKPFRGPEKYKNGSYEYTCSINGNFDWFQGKEIINFCGKSVYECYFHGGLIN
ncbi:DUF5680 domain-containing protein [Treponema vincentii]|uniref:DUF5680 domain-containing protein n=1 Tax=Treponema vincentii TaxID=69710 RepID=UPI0020A52E00|nr:DUF5680 domain-containing protein [Treponema vincentii]